MQIDRQNTRATHGDDRLFVWPAADAYVKPVEQEGKRVYAIYQADGQQVAVAETREMAFAFLGQQNVEAADAH
jgi:hypothetical protein